MSRTCFLLASLMLFAGCSALSANPGAWPSPSPASATMTPTPAPTAESRQELSATITPDFQDSFKQVVGRAPFTVTFGVDVKGGVPPYRFEWDLRGDGQAANGGEDSQLFVYRQPGTFDATVTVKDSAGRSTRAERRIVVLGPRPQIPAWKYGVNAHFERRRAGYYPSLDQVDRAAGLAEAAGVQAIRIDFNWDMLNPTPQVWTVEDYAAMVRIARAHKLELLGIIDYSSWWASSAQSSDDWRVRLYSEPAAIEYARFAYQTVSRFKNDVHVWEIWNEPNTLQFWKPTPNAEHYTALLQEGYLAVKYADPNAVVLFGGLSGNGIDGDDQSGLASNFLEKAYAAGAAGYFDVMSIHPYILPNSGIGTLRDKISAARGVLNRHGDQAIPIWLTEIGAPNDEPWWPTAPIQSEAAVAAWLDQVYTRLWDLTPLIFWYDLQDQASGDPAEQHFGLLRLDFSAKPAFDRFKALARQ